LNDELADDKSGRHGRGRKFSYKVPFVGILMARFMEGLST